MLRASDISNAAAQWLVRLEGQTTPQIWDSFQDWMDQDLRHRAAFIELRAAWKHLDSLKSLRPSDGTIDADLLAARNIHPNTIAKQGLQPLPGTQRRRTELPIPGLRRVVAIAAALAAVAMVEWFSSYHTGWKTYATSVGDRREQQLTDGSTIDLNTNTELNVQISNSRRDITLSRGEALFRVARDPSRPFNVTAGSTVIRAVGTQFSVRIRAPEDVEILVAEGRIAVGARGSKATAPEVAAGAVATVRHNSVEVRSLPATDVSRKLNWTEGYLTFQGETLNEAVQEFNRYNERQIRIADPSIVDIKVGGNFRATDVDSFTAALRHSYGFRVQAADNHGDLRISAGAKPPQD